MVMKYPKTALSWFQYGFVEKKWIIDFDNEQWVSVAKHFEI